MADNRKVIANLDFESIKSDMVDYFKSRKEFADYEFTGSSLNLLMDILAYNSHYYSLAANFTLSESFLDSALIRKNVVSLAKRLNYTPRSASASIANIQIAIDKQLTDSSVVIIPAGSLFTAASTNQSLSFYTIRDYTIQFDANDPVGTTKYLDIEIYQGNYISQRFIQSDNTNNFTKFQISEANIDTKTLSVSVNGIRYQKATPESGLLFSANSETKLYFIEENRDGFYELVFGNGVVGKELNAGDEIIITYLSTKGSEANGIRSFSASLSSRADARVIKTNSIASGGGPKESISEIKDQAPKWFQSQYRAVTTNDYEAIIRNKFADIQSISIYGGEDIGQPGKVFISIKPKTSDKLSTAVKEVLKSEIIKASNVVTVRPEIIDPNIIYLVMKTVVIYDKAKLVTNPEILKTKIFTAYEFMNTNYIGNFLDSFKESNLSKEIEKIDQSIVSSNSRLEFKFNLNAKDQKFEKYTYRLNNRIYHPTEGFLADSGGVLRSEMFTRVGKTFQSGFDDDGKGNIRLFDWIDDTKVYINYNAGRINYETGEIEFLYDVDPQDGAIGIFVVPDSIDVISAENTILQISTDDSLVEVIDKNEKDVIRNINLNRSI